MPRPVPKVAVVIPILAILMVSAASAQDEPEPLPLYEHWQTFTTEDGLPDDHIFWVEADPLRENLLWLGTENGLACLHLDDHSVETWGPDEGLGHRAVMGVEVDPDTGDVWVATFGGLSWLSGGSVVKTFTQDNSGLANDVVFGVVVFEDEVWAATTAGTSRFDPKTDSWQVYTSRNMPADENWCYNLSAGEGKLFISAWGGGIIEYDSARDRFRHYVDPDGEFEIELFPNDGLVHNITTSPSAESGLLWVTTYFGVSVYDFRRWQSFFDHDSGLASNFINFGRARPGSRHGYLCTDKGLSIRDHDRNVWNTYKTEPGTGDGVLEVWRGGKLEETRAVEGGIAHRYVLSVDFVGDDVWVGTGAGLSHGSPRPIQPPAMAGADGAEAEGS